MFLFFDLPKDLIAHILHDWINLCCTCRLDSAVLSTQTRPILLSILRDPLFIYNLDQIGTMSDKRTIHWIWTRRVGIEALVIPSESKDWTLDFDLLTAYLAERGKSLQYLSKVPYSQYSYGFFEKIPKYLNSSQLSAVLGFCPNLLELQEISTESVTLMSMASLRKHCPQLRHLSIVHHAMDSWDPTPLIALVAGGDCPIEQLRVPSVQKYWTKFSTVVKNMRKLTHLKFDRSRDIIRYEPDDSSFIAIATHCADIQMLYLSDTSSVYDSSLFALAHGCVKLQQLYLARCAHISTPAVTAIAQKCVRLSALDLSHCSTITDEAVIQLATHCTRLTELRLQKVPLLTDTAILALRNCPHLHTLDVSYCSLLNSSCINTLVTSCTCLKHLDLSSCTGLTDLCLYGIGLHCPRLEFIGLRNCTWVTDMALCNTVVHYCKMLCDGYVWSERFDSERDSDSVGGDVITSGGATSVSTTKRTYVSSFTSSHIANYTGSSLYNSGSGRNLRGIALTGCINVTPKYLEILGKRGLLCYE